MDKAKASIGHGSRSGWVMAKVQSLSGVVMGWVGSVHIINRGKRNARPVEVFTDKGTMLTG